MLNSFLHKNLRGLKNNEQELERITHIVGDNGSGKTSLLEAVTMLLSGKSFLSANKKELIRNSEKTLIISGQITQNNGQTNELRLSVDTSKSLHKVNNERISQEKAHLKHPICIIDANIINVSSGVPSYRRGLLDRAVFHVEPNHAKNHREFKRCLTQRNKALSKGKPALEVRAWNEPLCIAAEKISKARHDLLTESKPWFKEVAGEILGSKYSFSFMRGWKSENYLESLLRNEKKDRVLKSTSSGPQKEDFTLLCLDKKTKKYSSHGEEKLASISLVLSLNMALEQRKNMLSTMLFDELESGLDNNSLCKVLNIIKSLKNQQLITSLKHQTLPKKIKGNILYPTQN